MNDDPKKGEGQGAEIPKNVVFLRRLSQQHLAHAIATMRETGLTKVRAGWQQVGPDKKYEWWVERTSPDSSNLHDYRIVHRVNDTIYTETVDNQLADISSLAR